MYNKQKHVDLHFNRGMHYLKRNEIKLAIACFTKAIEVNPDLAEAYQYRGNAYLGKGELEKAIADYTQMLVLKPKNPEYYYIRGEVYLHASKWEEARRDLNSALLQGFDISVQFHSTHESIAAFEEKIGVHLPGDIADLLNSNPKTFEIDKDARIALAMKYYENEELSSGSAARLAGISRGVFIMLMGDYGLSPFGTVEDLKAELENVYKADHL